MRLYEFPREIESFVHERVLAAARARQRGALRPGVTPSGAALDVLQKQRTSKRLARALRVLRDELLVSEPLAHEALSYANGLEDALRFLALQFASDELPSALRALPGAPGGAATNSSDDDGALVVAVAASGGGESVDADEAAAAAAAAAATDGEDAAAAHPQQQAVADSWDDLVDDSEDAAVTTAPEASETSALSWTQQYLQVIAEREEEEARAAAALAKLTPEEKFVLALEAQFKHVLTAVQQAKADKASKKKQKALAHELQLLRQRLAERGWSDQEFRARESSSSSRAEVDEGSGRVATADEQLVSPSETTQGSSSSSPPLVDVKSAADADTEADEEDYGGSLFDDAASGSAAVGASATAAASSFPVDELLDPDAGGTSAATGTRKGRGKKAGRAEASGTAWTGKTPRDHVQDYCKKHKLPKPIYKKVAMKSRTHVYTLVLDWKTHKTEFVVPDDCGAKMGFSTIDEAKDTVCTHALYALSPNLPLYRVLPPLYRDMWLDWVRAKEQEAAAAVSQEKAGFDAVVDTILERIPDEVRAKVVLSSSSGDETETSASKSVVKFQNKEDEGGDEATADAAAGSSLLADWAVDDWDADLSDSESKDTSEQISDDWEQAYDDEVAPAEHEDVAAQQESPATQAYSQQLKEQLLGNMDSKAFKELWKRRQHLPISAFKTEVLEALETHNVILISGETGCGKSTQVPQFLLEDMLLAKQQGAACQIVCTQPRRLAAISLAERVSQELGEHSMGSGDSLCGFQIRLENRMTKHTRLLFCTTGILLRKLQEAATLGNEISHIIVDEVHERDLQNDVLLSMLRQFLSGGANRERKSPLKVILMSATLNAASFQAYFGGEQVCPMLSVPGRTFPVQELYLEDVLEMTEYVIDDSSPAYIPYETVQNSTQVTVSGRGGTSFSQRVYWEATSSSSSQGGRGKPKRDGGSDAAVVEYSEQTLKTLECIDASVINYELIQELIEHVVKKSELVQLSDAQPSASILVFLPGLQEISSLLDLLGGHRLFRDESSFSLLPLHSSLSPQDQQRIFQKTRGVVRIIATTNIAETSLTVEDVKVVIDSGRVKQMRHNSTQRTNVLDEIWISRANAKQRMGRAGRTSGGVCYRLFPRAIYRSTMDEQPVPEIKRAPLTSLCLQIKTFGVEVSCSEFLGGCLDPPDEASVRDALNELFEIGALERAQETLTTLGRNLARLPVDVKVGKMLLLGALFDVFDPICTSAAILETKSPFVAPYGHQSEMQRARKRFAVGDSDLLTDVNAYETWRKQFLHAKGSSNSRAEREFCRQHFLSHRSLMEITKLKQQFYGLVAQAGYLPHAARLKLKQQPDAEMLTREQLAMAAAILFAGLAPNLVHVERTSSDAAKKRFLLRDQDHTIVVVHPGSINHQNVALASPFLTYAVKLHTSQIYLPTSSVVMPIAVALFSHSLEILPQQARSGGGDGSGVGVRVNDWVVFQASYRSAMLLQELRELVMAFVASSMASPTFHHAQQSHETRDADVAVVDPQHAADLKHALRMLFENEFDLHDPKHALTRQLSSSSSAAKTQGEHHA